MSRVYWHARNRTAELHGSERAWLNHLSQGPGAAAWDLDTTHGLERAEEILSLVPEESDRGGGENYLHAYLREAMEQHARNMAVYEAWKPGTPMLSGGTTHAYEHRLVSALKTSLKVSGVKLRVAGLELDSGNVELNTALVAGSDPIRLAAKIRGWCEVHAWVEGPDRKWLAGVIDEGLQAGLYRAGMWYVDGPCDGPASQHPDRKWSSQGWEEVQDLLRESDDGPVVMSYSVCDQFPNPATHVDAPYRDVKSWQDYSAEEQQTIEVWQDRWYAMAEEDCGAVFDAGMEWLRLRRPWARLAPDTLASVTFGPGVTVYDLFARDRDERVRAAVQGDSDEEG